MRRLQLRIKFPDELCIDALLLREPRDPCCPDDGLLYEIEAKKRASDSADLPPPAADVEACEKPTECWVEDKKFFVGTEQDVESTKSLHG